MKQARTAIRESAEQSDGSSRGEVLIVDDDALVLSAYRRLLTSYGYRVRCAEDARSAALLLFSDPARFDVVVSDVAMPRVSGVGLLRQIRERDPDLPVILFTGWPTPEVEAAAEEAGAVFYLHKPVAPDVMERAVAEGVARRRLAALRRAAATAR